MSKVKVLSIIGTRPEAVKMAPVHAELQKCGRVTPLLLASGQHPTLLANALDDFGLTPDFVLPGFPPGLTLSEIGSRLLEQVSASIEALRPDIVLVHGDTSTTMMSALASFYFGIPVGHVEAGLRTNDVLSPFPEELNRQVVARIAHWNFAPTLSAKENLLNEGVDEERIVITGNTIVDSLKMITRAPATRSNCDFILVTLHRRENVASGMKETIRSIATFATEQPTLRVVFPMHPNPRVREIANEYLAELSNVDLIEPLGYRDFISALMDCKFVLTDSGGIQEEAVTLGKRVLVARDQSERAEPAAAESMTVVGTKYESVLNALRSAWASTNQASTTSVPWSEVFGDGLASARIVDALLRGA